MLDPSPPVAWLAQEAIERERRRQSGWRKQWARFKTAVTLPLYVRIALAWLFMWGLFVGLALIAVIYSRVLGPTQTRGLLYGWCFAQGQAYTLEVRARRPVT